MLLLEIYSFGFCPNALADFLEKHLLCICAPHENVKIKADAAASKARNTKQWVKGLYVSYMQITP
jgi:hypothetical protein